MEPIRGCDSLRQARGRTRREFLRAGGLGVLGLSLPDLIRA